MHSNRYRRVYRLSSGKQILPLLKSKDKKVDRNLFICSIDNSLDYPRLLVSVRRKFFPRAVDRNKIKRKIREKFRKNLQPLKGKDILVSVRPMEKPFKYSRIDKSMDRFIGR